MCPDSETIDAQECIANCRMKERCLAVPLLVHASRTRKYDRTNFSVTEVLSPTLIIYLKAKYGEVIDPRTSLPSAIGTATHALLENCLPVGYAGEFRLAADGVTGQMDCIDIKGKTLYDYKVTSAYKVATMLGKKYGGIYKEITRGKNKGKKKWVTQWKDGGTHHYGDYCKQQNLYRILLGKHGIEINDMYLQCIIKEPMSALVDFNLDKLCYLIKLPKMNDERLWSYAVYKRNALVNAIQNDILPKQCSPKDTWNGKRCKSYCSVAHVCPYL